MKKTQLLTTALSMALMVMFSCNNDQEASPKKKGDPIPKHVETGRVAGACGGYASGSYSGTGYYTYPGTAIDASTISSTGHIYVSCYAYDVPNRFTVKNSSGTTVAYTGWLGCTTLSGPWGAPFCNSSSQQLSFTRGSSTSFTLTVETVAPSTMNDAWEANISCSN
jgi:hypothetical protein